MANISEAKPVRGYILRSTDKAIHFEIHEVNGLSVIDEYGDPQAEWFPISQITSITKAADPQEQDEIMVKDWLLKTKDLLA